MPHSLLARIVRIGGNRLLNKAVDQLDSASPKVSPGLTGKLAGAALIRLATRSVPGAIVITGGLIAKTLHDRRKAKPQLAAPKDGAA